jgi:hypothetical protein
MRIEPYAPRPIGRTLYWMVVRPMARGKDWETLRAEVREAAETFDALFENVSDTAASVSVQGYMCLRNQLAHVTTANREIAKQLRTIRAGQSVIRPQLELFPEAGEKTLAELRQAHLESVAAVYEASAEPLPDSPPGEHPLFYALRARDWLALLPKHYDYHARQIGILRNSSAFQTALKLSS